jgi:pre-peptidase
MQLTLKRVQICFFILLFLFSTSLVLAQEAPTVLAPDTTATSLLSADNVADIYSIQATANTVLTIVASSGDVSLGILLSDSSGNALSEAAAADDGTVTIETAITNSGTYLVTVFAAPGEDGVYEINLSLAGTSTPATSAPQSGEIVTQLPAPSDILLNNGTEVRLQWNAAVDLNLEVRDPNGGTLYFDSRTSAIGGSFGFDANGVCDVISDTPVETATWQPGFMPTGSYEILVHYFQGCGEIAQAVPFTLTLTVNGEVLPAISATIAAPPTFDTSSVYLANFIISSEDNVVLNEGGAYPDSALNRLPATDISANAVAIQRDVLVQGAIFEEQDFVTYAFDAEANESITINMTANSGSLDTLLQLVDPNGNLVAVNDDAGNTTNSSINNVHILQTGTYLLVATRYGKEFGGTEGEFQLLVSESSSALSNEDVAAFNLPTGDIQVFLSWDTGADLQLLVRDPVGQSVYDDSPRVTSGGLLAANGNVACRVSEGEPVSYVYWPPGLLRPGTYEIDVWYENTCNDTRATEFTLTVVVSGQVIISERRVPAIGDRFVTNFTVNADGSTQVGLGGLINAGITIDLLQNEERLPIVSNVPAQGSITLDNAFDVYVFEGRAGQVVTISLEALAGGTLDANLFLLSAAGVTLRNNDDADPTQVSGVDGRTLDSLISGFILPADGQYLIVASRFGTLFGGTIGAYQLTIQTNQ